MNIKLALCLLLIGSAVNAQSQYRLAATYKIASAGGWDYIAVNQGKIYVSHSTQVNILNEQNGDSVGVIPNTGGVHGIAFNNALGMGYTSNGKLNTVTVFDLKTNEVLSQIATGENPDAIMFEPFTATIITCNGRSKNITIIDPKKNAVMATIEVGGKPETAVADGKGRLFINVEDKNEIVVVDLKTNTVMHHWPLGDVEGPTGLAYDKKTNHLFAGCDDFLVVVDAASGKVITKLPIGAGCDGVAFDADRNLIFTANGQSATVTIIKEVAADKYEVVDNIATKRGARTITIDEDNHTLYLPTADFETAVAGSRPKMIPGTFQVLVVKK